MKEFTEASLSSKEKKQIAELIYKSFELKFTPFLHDFNKLERKVLVQEMLTFKKGFYYQPCDSDDITGVALLRTPNAASFIVNKEIRNKMGTLRSYFFKKTFEERHTNIDYLHIDMLAVAEAERGKGIGHKLLDKAHEVAKQEGYKKCSLEVIDTNHRAKSLYERFGYTMIKYKDSSLLEAQMGYNGIYFMEKEL